VKNPADVRAERVQTFVAPVVPATTVGLALATSVVWLANWHRDRPNLDKITVVLAAELILLLVSAWFLRRVALAGRAEATGIAMIWLGGLISSGLCLVTYFNGNGSVQSLPLCTMLPLLALFFWPRDWHFAVGTAVSLVPPLLQLYITDHSNEERFMLRQLAGVTVIVATVIYIRVRRANVAIARMAADIEYRAAYDGLTGLHNRSHWFERVTKRYAVCQEAGQPASLLFLDIDRFKEHNDHVGHVEGDRLLRGVAAVLAEVSTPDHILGRFGGDEFIVFLPNTTRETADQYAERIGQLAARLETAYGNLAISIGATQALSHEHLDDFISRTDHAMFAAKSSARSREALDA
jgi:diguanylate cyclase (GGDEF)-like protein